MHDGIDSCFMAWGKLFSFQALLRYKQCNKSSIYRVQETYKLVFVISISTGCQNYIYFLCRSRWVRFMEGISFTLKITNDSVHEAMGNYDSWLMS